MEKELYYSDYKIINVEDGDDGYKRVELKNDKEHIKVDMPEWELAAGSTAEPTSDSDVRNLTAIKVVDEIYKVLEDLDVRIEDISYIVQKLLSKIQGEERKAINDKFGVAQQYDIRIKKHLS